MTTEPPLSRRIEELARYDEPEADAETGLSGSVSAVRAEVVAVRADLASLRGELGAVRTDLDGLGGRLTGSVAAGRTETGTLVRRVAELAGRFDALGGRVDEVRAELPGIAREVREGLELLPVRTGSQLDDVVGRVTDRVGMRVDQASNDMRRTVASALESDARTAAGTQSALVDARGALESRLAVLEDTLDGMAERIEALARDGASTTTARLAEIGQGVGRLEARVDRLGDEQLEGMLPRLREATEKRTTELADRVRGTVDERSADLRREVMAALTAADARNEALRTQVEQLATTTREVLERVTGTVEEGVRGVREHVTGALAEQHEATAADLAALREGLTATVTSLQEEQRRRARLDSQRTDGQLQSLDGRFEAVRAQVVAVLNDLRTDVANEVGVLRPRLEELTEASGSATAASSSLRTELTTDLASLRERITSTTASSTEAVRAALVETRDEVSEGVRALREALLDRMQEQHSAATARLDDLTTEVGAATGAVRDAGERIVGLAGTSDEVRRGLEALTAASGEATRASEAALVSLREGLSSATTEQLAALAEATRERLQVLERGQSDLREAVQTDGAARMDALAEATTARLAEAAEATSSRLAALEQAQVARLDTLVAGQEERLTAARDIQSERLGALQEEQRTRFAALEEVAGGLRTVVASFEEQWPTRTFEVVQGAKAAAEAVVKEVRAELQRRLDEVAAALGATEQRVELARSGLDAGTDRLAQAGSILVRYLEQRDRALEGERDSVLQGVLEQFAAGLSRLDREEVAALVGRAAERRRDVRDAERYRAAVGTPVPPTAELPDDVLALDPAVVAAPRPGTRAAAARPAAGRAPAGGAPTRGAAATGRAAAGRGGSPKAAARPADGAGGASEAADRAGAPDVRPAGADETPARETPARTTPARTTPARTTPARTTPARTTPARSAAARTDPAGTDPAGKDPAGVPEGRGPAAGAPGGPARDRSAPDRPIAARAGNSAGARAGAPADGPADRPAGRPAVVDDPASPPARPVPHRAGASVPRDAAPGSGDASDPAAPFAPPTQAPPVADRRPGGGEPDRPRLFRRRKP